MERCWSVVHSLPVATTAVSILLLCCTPAEVSGWLVVPLDQTHRHSPSPWTVYNNVTGIRVAAQVPGGVYGSLRKAGVLTEDTIDGFNDVQHRWVSLLDWQFARQFHLTAAAPKSYGKRGRGTGDTAVADDQVCHLEVDGIDTISDITINGVHVGSTDNQFAGYRFHVPVKVLQWAQQTRLTTSAVAQASETGGARNYINITVRSPVRYAHAQYERQVSEAYPVPPRCPAPGQHGECHVNHIRKMQSAFSWDWGPAVPDSAIWRSLRLRCFETLHIDGVAVDAWPQSPLAPENSSGAGVFWSMQLRLQLVVPRNETSQHVPYTVQVAKGLFSESGSFMVPPPDGSASDSEPMTESAAAAGMVVVQLGPFISRVRLTDDQLWWPNGMTHDSSSSSGGRGARLHALRLCWRVGQQLASGEGSAAAGTNEEEEKVNSNGSQCRRLMIGFREVQLVEEPVDSANSSRGNSFLFRVNGRPVFIKGTNWIPVDTLTERARDPARIRRLLAAAAAAHINMIRVWGGGVYESDQFYSEADRRGIMVWQDAMFACAMYPSGGDSEGEVARRFVASVRREMATQLWRLQPHASVVLWAANNENEAALRQNWFGTGAHFESYRRDYVRLYVATVRRAHRRVYGERAVFVTSSPSNGRVGSGAGVGFVAADPQSELYGDIHHYDYSSDLWQPAVYPVPRFASEYGVQSWPSRITLAAASQQPSRDLHLHSPFLQHRQHHPLGDSALLRQIGRHFRLPPHSALTSSAALSTLIYLSQVHQAQAVRVQTEHYRRHRPSRQLDAAGRGRTMGAMFWQLNDVWAAPTWSAIDHTGRWKLLMHEAVRFFQPLLLSLHVDAHRQLHVHCVSDLTRSVGLALLTFSRLEWRRFGAPRVLLTHSVTIAAQSAQLLWSGPVQTLGDTDRHLVRVSLLTVDRERLLAQSDLLPPHGFHNITLSGANVRVTVVEPASATAPSGKPDSQQHLNLLPTTRFVVHLASDAPAAFVSLESRLAGRFGDNGFHMMEARRTVTFTAHRTTSASELLDSIVVTSLQDTYQSYDQWTEQREKGSEQSTLLARATGTQWEIEAKLETQRNIEILVQ